MENYSDALLRGVSGGMALLYLAIIVLMIASLWKIFTKAGQPGWAAIIPIYNIYILLKIVGRPGWWLLLLLIPFVNLIIGIMIQHGLAKSFGKDVVYTLGLIFLGAVFYPLLAFGDAEYHGPEGMSSSSFEEELV